MIYQGHTLSVTWLKDGIARLELNGTGPVNTLDTATLISLSAALDTLETLPGLQGVIVTSAKPAFIVGADIKEFLSLFSAPVENIRQQLRFANQQFLRLEQLPVPVVSAVGGYALGGGCEFILATDYRVVTPEARIGLPETQLGIIPGFGGTVRLPRLIGNDNALELITTGRQLTGTEALQIGLADALTEVQQLEPVALKTLQTAISSQTWSQRRQQKMRPLNLSVAEAAMSFATAKALVSQKAGRHYPAPLAAGHVIEAAAKLDGLAALDIERDAFIPLAQSETAQSLIRLFLNEQRVKSLAKAMLAESQLPENVAVLGAGIMGGGIAWQSAWKGVPVRMKDIQQSALTQGIDEAEKLLQRQLERHKITPSEYANILRSITPQLDFQGFDQVDIVVEAVVENPKVKSGVLRETEQQVSKHTLLTSNTSTIPITLLAKNLARPENFCGMHFFNPVPKMPLVEVIRGPKTAPETLKKVVSWAVAMGKTPVVVNDCPGFFVNRVLFPYFAAFSLLLRDGADFRQIDRVMEKQFGWPMGPSWLLDVVGIDTAHHAQQVMAQGYPERMVKQGKDIINVLYDAGRYGQKNRTGFWRWEPDKRGRLQKIPDTGTEGLIAQVCEKTQTFSDQQIIDRMMTPMINEVVRCLEEKIIASPEEADMALIYGLGFPPFRGGIFRYLDTQNPSLYAEKAQTLEPLGPLYLTPELLREKMAQQASWYPQPEPFSPDYPTQY